MDHPFSIFVCRWWVDVIVAIYYRRFRGFVVIASWDVCPFPARITLRKFRTESLEEFLAGVGRGPGGVPGFSDVSIRWFIFVINFTADLSRNLFG